MKKTRNGASHYDRLFLLFFQARISQKKQERAEQEKKEQIQREKIRRAQGKDMSQARAQMEELEMKKLAEAKRREKEEARLAKQKVRDEIERDKRDRAAKFGKKSDSASSPAAAAAAAAAPAPSPAAPAGPPKEYDQCRLQIRLPTGQALTQTFGAKESLAAVRLYVEMNRTDDPGPFALMTSFPRKVFSNEDMEKPLSQLGLVPSAVLIVTKKQ